MALERKSRMKELKKTLKTLERCEVYIGVPSSAAAREEGSINNAVLGYLFEYGEPSRNMPQRPWLVPGVASVEARIGEVLARGAAKALAQAGRPGGGESGVSVAGKALHTVGLLGVSAVQGRIRAGIAPPLSEATVNRRLTRKNNRRSPGPMTPLIDTAAFIKSITYTVKIG